MWAAVKVNWERFFQFLHNEPFAKHWHCDVEGNKLCTMLKKRNPFLDGFRKWWLHAPKESAIPSEACSLGAAAVSLITDVRIRQLFIIWGCSDRDNIDSMSSGSMSPDLGDTWHHVLPTSPQWEGGLELDSDNDYEDETERDESYEAGDTMIPSRNCFSYS